MNNGPRDILFISYAREDRDVCSLLDAWIRLPARRLGYEIWWDQALRPGGYWSAELDHKLSRTGAAIVLVSIDALNSGFIWDREIRPLLAEQVPVAPLLVRPCHWEQNDDLVNLQFLDPPGATNALDHSDREEVLSAVARDLRNWLPSLGDDARFGVAPPKERLPSVDKLPKFKRGELHSVPSLPAEYQPRTELLNEFRVQLLGAHTGTTGITTPQRVGLHGNGGVGKSVLASALAHDDAVRLAFPDGIFWIAVGERANISILQERLAADLKIDISQARTNSERRRILASAVAERRCLAIVDDVWSGEGALSFDISSRTTRVLFTTRIERILTLPDLQAARLVVTELSTDEAIAFVRNQLGSNGDLPDVAFDVIEQTGRAIFALGLTVGAYLNGLSWEELHERFSASTRLYPEELEGNLRAMRVATSTLTDREKERYYDLVVFPTDEAVPITTISKFWAHAGDDNTQRLLDRFHAGRLLEADSEVVRFHDDQILYLTGQTSNQTARHAELLNAHKPSGGEWHNLAPDDEYMWDHLVYHLIKAAAYDDQDQLSSDLDWVSQHWFLNGSGAVERDLLLLSQYQDDRHVSRNVLRRARKIGHLLRNLDSLPWIANTLALHFADMLDTADLTRHGSSEWIYPQLPIEVPSDALERVMPGHSEGALAVTVIPSSAEWRLASVGADSKLKIWSASLADGEPEVFSGHEGWVNAVHAFSWRRDQYCATGGDDRTVKIWNLSNVGQPPIELTGHADRVTAIAVFVEAEEAYVCTASADRMLRVWRLSDLQYIRSFRRHKRPVYTLSAFKEADGWRIVSAGADAQLLIWNPLGATDDREIYSFRCRSGVQSVASFESGGQRQIVSGHDDGTLSIHLTDGTAATELNAHSSAVKALYTFRNDGVAHIASASDDGTIELRSGRDSFARGRTYRGHLDAVESICVFELDGVWHLCSASRDGSLRIWNLTSYDVQKVLAEGHTRRVRAISECRIDEKRAIATASEDGMVRIWRSDAKVSEKRFADSGSVVNAIAHWNSGESDYIAWGGAARTIWAAEMREVRGRPIAEQAAAITGMCTFRRLDGARMLATAGSDRTVRIWNMDQIRLGPTEMKKHESVINAICCVRISGRTRLLTVGSDNYMMMWDADAEATEPIKEYDHTTEVLTVSAFSDDIGWKCLTGTEDGVVRLIDLEHDAIPQVIGRLPEQVSAVAALQVGGELRVVTGTVEGRVALWNPLTGTMTAQIRLGQVVSAVVSTSIPGELAVAYDTSWALLHCRPRNSNI